MTSPQINQPDKGIIHFSSTSTSLYIQLSNALSANTTSLFRDPFLYVALCIHPRFTKENLKVASRFVFASEFAQCQFPDFISMHPFYFLTFKIQSDKHQHLSRLQNIYLICASISFPGICPTIPNSWVTTASYGPYSFSTDFPSSSDRFFAQDTSRIFKKIVRLCSDTTKTTLTFNYRHFASFRHFLLILCPTPAVRFTFFLGFMFMHALNVTQTPN